MQNMMFDKTIKIVAKSLKSVDEKAFEALLSESELTLEKNGKIIVSGLGKNVPICDKFVGTMLSMGLNANFLNTNSAVHGDLGMVRQGDLVIVLTKSGTTSESVYLIDLLKKRENVNIWLLTFERQSVLVETLGQEKCLVIDLEDEGDLWNIAPNNSTTLNLIILQELAMKLAQKRGVTLVDFKENHPGGAIGDKLK